MREVADRLTRFAKESGCRVVLVGHVTKDGALAGPRVLEHTVDCVLSFEGDRERVYRILRAHKNRFGSTSEAGVFEMRESGLVEVADASARFVAEAAAAPGSVVLCSIEGSRPLLVEVQALVAPSELDQPRRVANGVDRNRLALILAVLTRHASLSLGSSDVFVSRRWGHSHRRARGGSGDRARARLGRPGRPAGRVGPATCGLRRGRPHRRAAPRRAP